MMNKNMLTIGKSALGGKNKTKLKIFICLFSLLFLLLPFFSKAAPPNLQYTPLENIPGFEAASKTGDFYDYIQAVYKFGIWAVGISALLMISIGGFMYITSAGNNTSMEKAKSVITDAIIGLVLALTAYLLLYIINPDLVKIQKLKPIGTTSTTGGTGVAGGTGGATGEDTCKIYPTTNNVIDFSENGTSQLPSACDAYESDFQSAASATGIDAKILKAIAAAESSCKKNATSTSTPPSCGLMQLQPDTAGYDCTTLQNNPTLSIKLAAEYIKKNEAIHKGKLENIFAGYNGGYGTKPGSSGKKGPMAQSKNCPGFFAYECCIKPDGLKQTQNYIFSCKKYYNGQQ